MRYSLLSRFQGVLVGVELGEALEIHWKRRSTSTAVANLSAWPPQALVTSEQPGWSKVAEVSKAILQSGGRSLPLDSIAALKPSPTTRAELLLATLPLVLFLHEDEVRLRQALERVLSPTSLGGALAIGFAIAQALREKLEPLELIPQTIAFLKPPMESAPAYPGLVQQLEEVQTALRQNVSLQTIAVNLRPASPSDRAVALAFYCFLSSPEDLRLCLLRSAQTPTPFVSALTGALAGAYNSTIGIPLEWMLDPSSGLQLGDQLWSSWSGALSGELVNSAAIASPDVIRTI